MWLGLRDQDGDLHAIGDGETLVAVPAEDGSYFLIRMIVGLPQDESVVVFRGTKAEAANALELVWAEMKKGNSRAVVDFTEHRTELWEGTQEPKKPHLTVVPLHGKGDEDE